MKPSWACAIAILALSGPALAQSTDQGQLITVAGRNVYLVPAQRIGKRVRLARLPKGMGRIRSLTAGYTGRAILVQGVRKAAYVSLDGETVRSLPCRGGVAFDVTDRWVTCRKRKKLRKVSFIDVEADFAETPLEEEAIDAWMAPDSESVVYQADRAFWKIEWPPGGPAEKLETPVPRRATVSPSLSHVVGRFKFPRKDGLFVTRLGKTIRRQIGDRRYRPVAWSGDGEWLLVQGRISACAIRVTGGQYKCWLRVKALGFARGLERVLVHKAGWLQYVEMNGPRPEKPRKIRPGGRLTLWVPSTP